MKNKEENKKITPSQYFDILKDAKQTITTQALSDNYSVILQLAEKYKKLGQIESLKKLSFLAQTLIKEEKLIENGVTTFVYRDVIEDYIENVADNTVKIIELSRYMREIPDEFVETIEQCREIFDEMYVVFTDYTGKEERKVEKERRDKDPILFGVFKNSRNVADRFYFIGDWIDEYCDLTLDKMVDNYKTTFNKNPKNEIVIPKNDDELIELLKQYVAKEGDKNAFTIKPTDSVSLNLQGNSGKLNEKKTSFFDKIRNAFKKK